MFLSHVEYDQPQQTFVTEQKSIGPAGEPFVVSSTGINPALQLFNVPYVGRYSSHYPMGWHLMLIEPPLPSALPQSIQKIPGIREATFYILMVETRSIQQGMQRPVINLVTHAWAFPHLQPGATQSTTVEMGIFTDGCVGIKPAKNNSISVGGISRESVIAHPAGSFMCCSPNHARFRFTPELPYNDFWSFCRQGNRSVLCYHVLVNHTSLIDRLYQKLYQAQTVSEALRSKWIKIANGK